MNKFILVLVLLVGCAAESGAVDPTDGPSQDGGPTEAGKGGSPSVCGSSQALTACEGTTGPKGDKGDKGEPGKDGQPGRDGTNGTNGSNGVDGQPGAQGPQGLPGAPGAAGARGATGLQGPQGATGAKGDKGADGEDGVLDFSNIYEVRSMDNIGGSTATDVIRNASCHSGDVLISGGCIAPDASSDMSLRLLSNGKAASSQTWICTWKKQTTTTPEFTATALCLHN